MRALALVLLLAAVVALWWAWDTHDELLHIVAAALLGVAVRVWEAAAP